MKQYTDSTNNSSVYKKSHVVVSEPYHNYDYHKEQIQYVGDTPPQMVDRTELQRQQAEYEKQVKSLHMNQEHQEVHRQQDLAEERRRYKEQQALDAHYKEMERQQYLHEQQRTNQR